MAKELNGRELADYVKARQERDVRRLKQAGGINPKLAIISVGDDPASQTYMRLKQAYGADIGIAVEFHQVGEDTIADKIRELNADELVHGIIVQLPLPNKSEQQQILNLISPTKDVDGLGENAKFDAATPLAIIWLLNGYDITLAGKKILIIGKGKLVGSPLSKMWFEQGLDLIVADSSTQDLAQEVQKCDILVSATGHPGLINSSMLRDGQVVVDAGVAEIDGTLKGDFADDVHGRTDIIKTPIKGGVGPLTVAALFENLLKAAGGVSGETD